MKKLRLFLVILCVCALAAGCTSKKEKELAELKAKKEELSKKLKHAKNRLDEVINKIPGIEKELEAATRVADEAFEKKLSTSPKGAKVMGEMDGINKELKDSHSRKNRLIGEIQDKFAKDDDIMTLKKEIFEANMALEAKIRSMADQVPEEKKLVDQMDKLTDYIDGLYKKAKIMKHAIKKEKDKKKIKELRSNLDTVNAEIKDKTIEKGKIKGRFRSLVRASQNETIVNLRQEMESKRESLEQKYREKADKSSKTAKKQAEIDKIVNSIPTLQEKFQICIEDLRAVKMELYKNEDIAALRKKVSDLKNGLKGLLDEKMNLEIESKRMGEEISNIDKRMKHLQQDS